MRAVRCDVCGAKAMIAAAKCPSCGNLFELRDGFGELVPLGYCSSCASYYPASVGSCRWCGTKSERPPISPRIWRGAGAAVVVLVGAIWVFRNGASEDTGRARAKPAPPPTAAASADPLSTDTTTARLVVATTDSAPAQTPIVDTSSIARDNDAAPSVAGDVMPKTAPPPTAPVVASTTTPTKSARAALPASRRSARWVRSVSRHWVVIRAGASSDSRIIASIGPNSRVELGESRGSWRRIRAKGLAGWVEPRSSFELVASR